MKIIGIDPGISGSICFFQDGKIIDVIEMPTMTEGKKNKRQVNGAQIFNEVSKRIPLGRLARSDEYQGTLLWMLSDASSYLNGAVVSVDGGRTTW